MDYRYKPNRPLPDQDEFYGDCKSKKHSRHYAEPLVSSGLVLRKENGIGTTLECLNGGMPIPVSIVETCGEYFHLLPSFCQTDNYIGQCKNGKPDGVGIKTINKIDESWTIVDYRNIYEELNGQFSNGVPNGYVIEMYSSSRGGGTPSVSNSKAWYVNGQKIVNCPDDSGVEKCKAIYQAEPARLAKEKREEREREAKIQKYRKHIKEGDDTTAGVVVQVKGSLVKIQTNESQCTQRDSDGDCRNYVSTPTEKWFKRSEVYPRD